VHWWFGEFWDEFIIKQLKSGKYALKWYSTEEESIKNAHEFIKERLLRSPTPEEIAYRIKEPPGKARELLFKYIQGYSEPTVEEIEEAANKVWDLMFWGDVLSQIQIDESTYDINIIHINCRAWIDKVEEFEDREQLVLESKSYLERYPEMKPEIVSWIDDDTQFFEAKWADEVLAYISKFSVYKKSFYTL
jgi:DNA-directed RNA polymerase specialized sigma subunit